MPRRRDDQGDTPDLRPILNEAEQAFGRLPPRTQAVLAVVAIVVGLIVAVVYFRWQSSHQSGQNPPVAVPGPTPGPYPPGAPGAPDPATNLLLGNPSGATADPGNRDNYLMVKPYFALSYNNANGTPNWVSWRVTAADLGTAPRKPFFDADSTLPPGFKVVQHKDYSGSGFDRGHMCPHSDRASSESASFATFVMTNIVPQAPNLNRKAWAQEEEYLRTVVKNGNRLYVLSGPLGRGGTGSNGPANSIAGGKVAVPSATWKVAVVVPVSGGEDDLAKINASTRVLSVIMPNDNNSVGEEWGPYRVSTAEVERQTHLHFFDRLPASLAQTLKQKVDAEPLPAPRPLTHGRGGGD